MAYLKPLPAITEVNRPFYSYTISYRGPGAFDADVPYAIVTLWQWPVTGG